MLSEQALNAEVDARINSVSYVLNDFYSDSLSASVKEIKASLQAILGTQLDWDAYTHTEQTIALCLAYEYGYACNLSRSDAESIYKQVAREFKVRKNQIFTDDILAASIHAYRLRCINLLNEEFTNAPKLNTQKIESIAADLQAEIGANRISRLLRLLAINYVEVGELIGKDVDFSKAPVPYLAAVEIMSSQELNDATLLKLWQALEKESKSNSNYWEKLQRFSEFGEKRIAINIVADALRDRRAESTHAAISKELQNARNQAGVQGLPKVVINRVNRLLEDLDIADDLAYLASRLVPLKDRPMRARAAVILGSIDLITQNESYQLRVSDDRLSRQWQGAYGHLDREQQTVYDALERVRFSLSTLAALQLVFADDQRLHAGLKSLLPTADESYTNLLELTNNFPLPDALSRQIIEDVVKNREKSIELLETLVPDYELRRLPGIDRAVLVAAVSHFYGLANRGSALEPAAIDTWVTLATRLSTDRTIGFINAVLDSARSHIFAS